MRDDAGRRATDGGESGGDTHDPAHWDETMHQGEDGGDADESGGNVAGEFSPSGPIEPGRPSLENSLFVLFGAYLAVLGLTRLFVDTGGFDARDLLVITGGTLLLGVVLMGFLGSLTPDT